MNQNVHLIGPHHPFYSYGGPTRSLTYLSQILKNHFKLKSISPNTELNGDKNDLGKLDYVIYTNKSLSYLIGINPKDIIWLNDIFKLNLMYVLIVSFFLKQKIIISPRGQLAKNAINTKRPILKRIFIRISKIFISKNIFFHATSNSESKDIKSFFPKNYVSVIPNLSSVKYHENQNFDKNFVFFSRISKKKGLIELLECIDEYNFSVDLDIYGYKEDLIYWNLCEKIINKYSKLQYKGELKNGNFSNLINNYTFFLFPTYNENYGHVVIEAIALGLIPILSSGTTPFDKEINNIIGLNFDRNSKESIIQSLEKAKNLSEGRIKDIRLELKAYFKKLNSDKKEYEKQYVNFVKKVIQS